MINRISNTSAENSLLKIWRDNEIELRDEVRNQALVDVSSILGWFTCKDYSREYLHEMVLRSFEEAAKELPENSTIRSKIEFYKQIKENKDE